MERRGHPRVVYAVPARLACRSWHGSTNCRIRDIGMGGLYALSPSRAPVDTQVELLFRVGADDLVVSGRVQRSDLDGVAIKFDSLSAAQSAVLEQLIWPDWDGHNLMEGVLLLAAFSEIRELKDLMHLTTIVEEYGRRDLAHRFAMADAGDLS